MRYASGAGTSALCVCISAYIYIYISLCGRVISKQAGLIIVVHSYAPPAMVSKFYAGGFFLILLIHSSLIQSYPPFQ